MTRKITAKAQNGDLKIEVAIKLDTKNYMLNEVDRKVDSLKNEINDLLRRHFNQSEIKIS